MTRDGSATQGEDFLGVNSGHITIPAGSLTGHITVWIKGDLPDGVDPETFSVVLTSAYNTTINGSAKSATGSIKQQSTAVTANTVNIASTYTQSTSTSTVFNVPVTLTGPAAQPVTVFYNTGGPTDTAVPGVDYVGVGSGHISVSVVEYSGSRIRSWTITAAMNQMTMFVTIGCCSRLTIAQPAIGSRIRCASVLIT